MITSVSWTLSEVVIHVVLLKLVDSKDPLYHLPSRTLYSILHVQESPIKDPSYYHVLDPSFRICSKVSPLLCLPVNTVLLITWWPQPIHILSKCPSICCRHCLKNLYLIEAGNSFDSSSTTSTSIQVLVPRASLWMIFALHSTFVSWSCTRESNFKKERVKFTMLLTCMMMHKYVIFWTAVECVRKTSKMVFLFYLFFLTQRMVIPLGQALFCDHAIRFLLLRANMTSKQLGLRFLQLPASGTGNRNQGNSLHLLKRCRLAFGFV